MDDETDWDREFKLDVIDCVNCKKLPLNSVTLPLVKINSFAIEPLNVFIELLTLPLNDIIELLIDELTFVIVENALALLFVTVPLIDDDTAANATKDCDVDELINNIVLLVFVPPVKFALWVTATGT